MNDYMGSGTPVTTSRAAMQVQVNTFIQSVYGWMALGLGITGLIAYLFPFQLFFRTSPFVFWGILIAEIGLVFYLSARIEKLSATAATGIFLAYAALNGVTLSFIFVRYTAVSITSTFVICALTFAAASVYGMITKRDLTGMGSFLMMGLIGIIIATVVNFFLRSPMIYMLVGYIGVIIFVGLTAYDTQKIKALALSQPADIGAAAVRKAAIMGALELYLDFINLFLMLLRIFGNSSD